MSVPEMAAALGAVITTGLGILTAGIFHPRVRIFGPQISRTKGTSIALTFDDGPHPTFTPRIAEVLTRAGVKATFFCIGQRAEKHPDIVRSLAAAGHLVENHTYSHNTGAHLFSAPLLTEDLRRCQEVLEALTGRRPRLYRPAVGIRNPAVHAAAKAVNLSVVTWSQAPRDGVKAFTPQRADALAQRTRAGDILVLHDGVGPGRESLRESTVTALPRLLTALRDRGFVFQTLSSQLE